MAFWEEITGAVQLIETMLATLAIFAPFSFFDLGGSVSSFSSVESFPFVVAPLSHLRKPSGVVVPLHILFLGQQQSMIFAYQI